jgi:hypothetical protein
MKLTRVDDITRKPVALHYRNEYAANAVFGMMDGKLLTRRIEFIVEMNPLGAKDIRIQILDPIDYPLIPILKSLKEEIRALDSKGALL